MTINLILQTTSDPSNSSAEIMTVVHAAMLQNGFTINRSTIDDLRRYSDINPQEILPVGSVEFLHEAFDQMNINRPEPIDYPDALLNAESENFFFRRQIIRGIAPDDSSGLFIKPAQTKAFDPVINQVTPADIVGKECWLSTLVSFTSEWRLYVMKRQIIGVAQYNDGTETHLPSCLIQLAERAIAVWGEKQPVSYAIDVGILSDGEPAIVEINDAWATGFYKGAMTSGAYLGWLQARWLEVSSLRTKQNPD